MSISTTPTTSQTKLAQALADSATALALASAPTTLTVSGDVVGTASGTTSITPTLAIGANVVSNAQLAQVPSAILKGRVSASTGNVENLTGTQATTLLDPFTTALKGLAPPPGLVSGKVLSDNGTWITPNAGTVTSVSVASANGFSGSVATPGTTPAITLSTTVNGLLKGSGSSIVAAIAGTDYSVGPLVTSTILDFGTGKDTLSATVALTGVLTTSMIIGSVCWDSSFTTRSEEELSIDPITLSFRAGTNQVIVNAAAVLRTVVGKYKISIVAY